MDVEPVGLPQALKAWRSRQPEAVLTVRCGAPAGCDREVGAVYRSPEGLVLESWLTAPETSQGLVSDPVSPETMSAFAEEMGLTGLLDDVGGDRLPAPAPEERQKVRAQMDLVKNERYWQDPQPVCPEHGALRIHRRELDQAVTRGEAEYRASVD